MNIQNKKNSFSRLGVAAHLAMFALTLSSCTNGMMGDTNSVDTDAQTQFVDQGAQTDLPAEIELPITTIVGKFKSYEARVQPFPPVTDPSLLPTTDPNLMGIVVDVSKPLTDVLTADVLADYVSRAATETAVGDIPVSVLLPHTALGLVPGQGRKVSFAFRELVSASALKNTLIIFPNSSNTSAQPPVLAKTPVLPITATVVQFHNHDLYVVGGLKSDGTSSNKIVRIPSTGIGAVELTIGTNTNVLNYGVSKAVVLTPQWATYIKDNYMSAPSTNNAEYSGGVNITDQNSEDYQAFQSGNYLLVVILAPSAQSWPNTVQFTPNTNPWNGGNAWAFNNNNGYQYSNTTTNNDGSLLGENIFKSNIIEARFILFKPSGTQAWTYCNRPLFPEGTTYYNQHGCTPFRRARLHAAIVEAEWNGGHKIADYANSLSVQFAGPAPIPFNPFPNSPIKVENL